MFDIKWIRDNPEAFDAGLRKRGIAPGGDVKFSAELIMLDEKLREVTTRLQEVQARRNAASKEVGKAKGAKDEAKAAALMAEVNALKDELDTGENERRRLGQDLRSELMMIPNMPRDDVPIGRDENDNQEIRMIGMPSELTWTNNPKQHFEIGEMLGLMDFETAVKLSGARFVVLKGALARLERALGAFMLDLHTTEFGYVECNPPLLVKDGAALGTGNLPKFANDLFQTRLRSLDQILEEEWARLPPGRGSRPFGEKLEDLGWETIKRVLTAYYEVVGGSPEDGPSGRYWLIPTAEVALTNLVRKEIVDEDKLPMRLTALTPCFRSEAGAAGKDTRGMIRQHQFSKVELVSITTPEQSSEEHERMTACAEEVLKRLGLAYRTMLLCTGDMGFASQKTYDIEVWLPGQDTYREISSCSVCGDFQARRMNARYRPKGGKGTEFVHTLNGSGLAVGRTLIAILENYQQADGSVAIPDALQPYMGGLKKIEAA